MRVESFPFLTSEPTIVDSGNPGPTSVILGGVHGDEICGVFAMRQMMTNPETLRVTKGKVILMYGNLEAIKQNKRLVGENLNRMFLADDALYSEKAKASYEYKRAMEIRPYLQEADVLLDLHSVGTLDSVPFIICENNGVSIANRFDVSIVCSGLDEAHPGGTDGYMNTIGKIGLCMECGQDTDPVAVDRAMEGVRTFLDTIGHTDKPIPPVNKGQRHIRVTFIYKNEAPFTLERDFEEFEDIKEGDLIGKDGDKEVRADRDGLIMFARSKQESGGECFCIAEVQ